MDDASKRNSAAEVAVARVLSVEREARGAIARAQVDASHIAEEARAAARRLSERTEQRVRCIVAAFERDLAARVAAIDAETAKLDVPQPVRPEDRARLERAVVALARQLAGATP
ncbi:MAG TPA: hypothetical protein VGH48_10355 [Caldimonas sp.]|jgi:hypothetical protein